MRKAADAHEAASLRGGRGCQILIPVAQDHYHPLRGCSQGGRCDRRAEVRQRPANGYCR